MSSSEYNNMFLKCQNTGKYHMFVFDIIDSKKMDNETRRIAQIKMLELMKLLYMSIEKIDSEQNKILVFEEGFKQYGEKPDGFGMKIEPFVIGDAFGFTIYRDSLQKHIIYELYEILKKQLNIDFDFHLADGYYETNNYEEGNNLYFRGYCIEILSNLHKQSKIKLKR